MSLSVKRVKAISFQNPGYEWKVNSMKNPKAARRIQVNREKDKRPNKLLQKLEEKIGVKSLDYD